MEFFNCLFEDTWSCQKGNTISAKYLLYECHEWDWPGNAATKQKHIGHYFKNPHVNQGTPPSSPSEMTTELTPKQMPALPPTFIVISVTKMAVKM